MNKSKNENWIKNQVKKNKIVILQVYLINIYNMNTKFQEAQNG